MEMRIVVPDATSASALAERLTVAFGARRISRLHDRPEVGVQVGRHSDRAVLRVLDAVDGWLDHSRRRLRRAATRQTLLPVHQMSPPESWQRPSRNPLELADTETPNTSSGPDGAIAVLNREEPPVGAPETHPSTVDQQTSDVRSNYWLEHSEGFQVFGTNGRIGTVA